MGVYAILQKEIAILKIALYIGVQSHIIYILLDFLAKHSLVKFPSVLMESKL